MGGHRSQHQASRLWRQRWVSLGWGLPSIEAIIIPSSLATSGYREGCEKALPSVPAHKVNGVLCRARPWRQTDLSSSVNTGVVGPWAAGSFISVSLVCCVRPESSRWGVGQQCKVCVCVCPTKCSAQGLAPTAESTSSSHQAHTNQGFQACLKAPQLGPGHGRVNRQGRSLPWVQTAVPPQPAWIQGMGPACKAGGTGLGQLDQRLLIQLICEPLQNLVQRRPFWMYCSQALPWPDRASALLTSS